MLKSKLRPLSELDRAAAVAATVTRAIANA
jgi:hypothetical protein